MKILLVDIGTGTQDIFLYDSRLDLENCYKLILPAPTMRVHGQIHKATSEGSAILLTGRQMGGGPAAWAAEAHSRAGLKIYATPDAALTLNDELDQVEAAGIRVISEDEAMLLPESVIRIRMRDFDFQAIARALNQFDIALDDLRAVAVAVFDHGAAPAGTSDRQFRFDYLDATIKRFNSLSAFAYRSGDVPNFMSRLAAVARSADEMNCPMIVMDTAPAAVLGATFDPVVANRAQKIIVNVGNFHTLAFRIGVQGIEGVFEHHTGEINLPKLDNLLRSLANSTLKHSDVFNDMGHGALIYNPEPISLAADDFDVAVTGPRRSIFRQKTSGPNQIYLRHYFAVPYGDMMLTGCYGLLAATADLLPELKGQIIDSMEITDARAGRAPWETE